MRSATAVPCPSCFAPPEILVVGIAELPNRSTASRTDRAHLTGRQNQNRPSVVAGNQPCRGTRTTGELAALADVQLDVVYVHSRRHILERHRIAHLRLDTGPALHDLTGRQPQRGKNVPLFAVRIFNQRNVTRAVRIVLDRRHRRGNAIPISFEINSPVNPTRTTTAVPRSNSAVVIASAMLGKTLAKRLQDLSAEEIKHRVATGKNKG